MNEVAAALNVSNPLWGKKVHRPKLGVCAYRDCPGLCGGPMARNARRTKFFCGACNGGKGAFYHLPCFNACHRITKP